MHCILYQQLHGSYKFQHDCWAPPEERQAFMLRLKVGNKRMGAPPEERYTSFHVQIICRTRPAHSGTLCIVELIIFINSYLPDIWTEFKLLNDELWSPYKYCLICKNKHVTMCHSNMLLQAWVRITLLLCIFMLRSSLYNIIPNAWHLAQDLWACMDG